MSLEEAITKFVEILRGAMAADARWLYLVRHLDELVDAGNVILQFAMEQFRAEPRVKLTEGVDMAGAGLRVMLCDVLDETDQPQLGPIAWIAIARLILRLLEQIKSTVN